MGVLSVCSPSSQFLDGSCESEDEDSEPVWLLLSAPFEVSEGPEQFSKVSALVYLVYLVRKTRYMEFYEILPIDALETGSCIEA